MTWTIRTSDEFKVWHRSQRREDRKRITAALLILEETGPVAGRPLVDRIKGSRYQNLKELRIPSSTIRLLFLLAKIAPPTSSLVAIRPARGRRGTERPSPPRNGSTSA